MEKKREGVAVLPGVLFRSEARESSLLGKFWESHKSGGWVLSTRLVVSESNPILNKLQALLLYHPKWSNSCRVHLDSRHLIDCTWSWDSYENSEMSLFRIKVHRLCKNKTLVLNKTSCLPYDGKILSILRRRWITWQVFFCAWCVLVLQELGIQPLAPVKLL